MVFLDIVRMLFLAEADVNTIDYKNWILLYIIVFWNSYAAVEILLEYVGPNSY